MFKDIIVLFAVFMVHASAAQEAFIGKVIFVADGDTLGVRLAAGVYASQAAHRRY